MKNLTNKEEEIMNFFWEKGALLVKEIQEFYLEPKPHINTVSTMVRLLEEKGYVGHESLGKTYRYFATVSKEEFSKKTLTSVIQKYFDNSYLSVVSSLIEEEDISLNELKKLITEVEKGTKNDG